MEKKILTRTEVRKLGLDKVSVITAKMLNGYTEIGNEAFVNCYDLTSVTIPNGVTSIGRCAFSDCSSLTSVRIPNNVISIKDGAFYNCTKLPLIKFPNSITSIGLYAFGGCRGLMSLVIGGKEYKTQSVKEGNCSAYKAFNANMTCCDFQYKEGKAYELNEEPILCEHGFHACLNIADVFNYYYGKLGKNIVVHKVELENVSNERLIDSKVVAKKITIKERIL